MNASKVPVGERFVGFVDVGDFHDSRGKWVGRYLASSVRVVCVLFSADKSHAAKVFDFYRCLPETDDNQLGSDHAYWVQGIREQGGKYVRIESWGLRCPGGRRS